MSRQCIIRQTVAFGDKLEIRFAGLEKNFDLPAFSINTYDLFLREACISTDESDPVLLFLLVPDADDPGGDLLVLSDHDVNGKKIFAASGTLPAHTVDLVYGKALTAVFVIDTGTLLIMAMLSSPSFLTARSWAGLENHVSNST